MRKQLLIKFMLPAVAITLVMMTVLGVITAHVLESEVRERAESNVLSETDRVLENLNTIDTLSSQNIRAAMNVLLREGQSLGVAEIKGSATVAGEVAPDLNLGGSSQVGNFALVDRVKDLTGDTATLFVKRGDGYVRVSTNVLKPDGSRAVGTELDPKGRAIAAIRQQQSFYGVVDILGKPYMTGYEPMRDKSGQIIGVWYVGAPLATLAGLGRHISSAKILDNGFVALLKPNGEVIFKSDQVHNEDVQRRLDVGSGGGWTLISKPFEKWGYTLIVAYPEADVSSKTIRMKLVIAAGAVIMTAFLMMSLYWMVTRFVLRPVVGLVRVAENIASGNLTDELAIATEDEIGDLARSFAHMVTYIKEMASVSEAIAGGDLSVDVTPRSQYDTLGHAFQRMAGSLASLVRSVRDRSQQVASGARQVAIASDDSAKVSVQASSAIDEVTSTMHEMSINVQNMVKNTQMQASSVSETAASINQMVASIQSVADTARVLLDISNRSQQEVQNGIGSMEKAADGLNRINGSIQVSSGIIDVLGQRADDIGKIIEVIDDLAEQTNLLALNAAIEAARAGEHGLGFAVVADEVRKLAEKSAQSTKEISELIQNMQKEARRAVDNMEKSSAIVNDSLSLGTDLSAALKKISNVVTEVYKFAQGIGGATNEQSHGSSLIAKATTRLNAITLEINSAVEEQASGTQAVVTSMDRMRELVQRSSSSSTELAASAEQMSRMAGGLTDSMDRFRLEAPEPTHSQAAPRARLAAAGRV
jgi:methyl-accepting chemotaxis protein